MNAGTTRQTIAGPTSTARPGSAPPPRSLVLVVLLVLDVASPTTTSARASSCPSRRDPRAPGARGLSPLAGREVTIYWVGSPKYTAGHPAPLIALVHHRMVGTLRSTDAAFTSTDGREASTHFGIGYGCGRAGHPTSPTSTST